MSEDPPVQHERIDAGDIKRGMQVARARTHAFHTVAAVSVGPKAISISYADHGYIERPRKTARWWRIVEPTEATS